MDSSSAAEKIHTRLTADLEADRALRPSASSPEQGMDIGALPSMGAISVSAQDAPETAEAAPSDERADLAPPVENDPPYSQTLLPTPANGSEPDEEPRIYARGPTSAAADPAAMPGMYTKADPSTVVAPDRERFYEVGYRSNLRNMIDHVIEIEGPIYFDVLIDRVARAHGFQRSGETVQRIIRAALGLDRFPTSRDGDREIIWPQNTAPSAKSPYRGGGCREHGDVPLPELAGLGDVLRAQGLEEDEDLIRGMQEHFGLGRLAISTRQRFEAAIMSDEN